MSHNIEHFEYPQNVSKQDVEKELNSYIAHEDWQEGCSGLYHPIRWLDDKVYDTYNDACEAINRLDKGWYDNIAVQYYERETKADDKYKELEKKSDELYKEFDRRDKLLYSDFVISNSIGCKKCGSRLASKWLRSNFCPVCKNDLRPEHMLKSVEAAKAKANRARKAAADYLVKVAKKRIMWLVKIEYHT